MSRKKRQTTKQRAAAPRTHPAKTAIRCGALAAALAATIWASLRVRDYVQRDERYWIGDWPVELGELPEWVTPEIRAEIESVRLPDLSVEIELAANETAGEPAGDEGADAAGAAESNADRTPERIRGTLFERGVLDRLRDALLASPWVSDVTGISAVYPSASRDGALLVALELRRPIAIVEYEGLHYLTDRRGARLGEPYSYAPVEWFRIPVITGIEERVEVPAIGDAWASREIDNGLAIARVLDDEGIARDYPGELIESIDVSNLGGRRRPMESEVVLAWEGRRLTWGRAPLSSAPRVVGASTVVEHLRRVLGNPDEFADCVEIHLHRRVMTGIRGASTRTFRGAGPR